MTLNGQTVNKRKFTVLRPISTTGLTAADVGTLADRVRNQMLDALRDISVKLESKDFHKNFRQEQVASRDSSESGPQLESTNLTTLTSGTGIELESIETIPDVTGSCSSSASSLTSSHRRTLDAHETGAETEEDDGMILVGRPPT